MEKTIDVVQEVADYFKISRDEAYKRLETSWQFYLDEFEKVNSLDQIKDFKNWEKKTIEWYNHVAHIYEQTWFRYFLTPRKSINALINEYTGNVLDIACGVGRFSLRALYLNKCDKVTFYDISKTTTNFLKYLTEIRGLKDRCKVTTDFSEVNEKYDRIIMTDFLEHIENPVEYCRNLKDKLSPGGIILVHAPFQDQGSPTHLKMHKDLTIDKVFLEAGYDKSQYKEVNVHGDGVCEKGEF